MTTADAAPAASDALILFQTIEGYRVERLAFGTASAQPLSIGFWTKIHRPGTYSGSIRNAAQNRSYPFSFVQNVADVWEFKTATIPGDVTGTWAGSNNPSLLVIFAIMAGSTYLAAAGAWAAGNYYGVTGTANGAAATSDIFQITGLVVLPGVELPSAARAPFIMRTADQEQVLSQRYYERVFIKSVTNGGYFGGTWPHKTAKRTTPTFSYTDSVGAVGKIQTSVGGNGQTVTGGGISSDPISVSADLNYSGTAGTWVAFWAQSDARM